MKKDQDKAMTRREFFAAGAGIAGCAALSMEALAGGGPGAPWGAMKAAGGGAVRPARMAGAAAKARVVLIKTDSRVEGVKKCLELWGENPFEGKRVLVKPNFNTSDECPGSTHNDTLGTLLGRLRDMGAKSLTVGDRSGPEPTEQVFDKKGVRDLAASFEAELLNFDELGERGYVKKDPPASHWKNGFLVARPVATGECVVSTCCLKTHQFGGVFSMSLKNSVGVVPRKGHNYMRQLHSSPDQRRMIAEINTAYSPALVVLDGLEAFVDEGPMTGPRKDAGVFLAGTDRVAVDAVGVAILKHLGSNDAIMKPGVFEQEQISWAAQLELGASSPADIAIETHDSASEAYAETIRKILAAG
ncbi:MAG: DUF362 domain-containing protein [Candidatus Aminicenantes bacterium]|nr:DUF362 domain-containing protein [Candidatus Aminicenantes bacterium]